MERGRFRHSLFRPARSPMHARASPSLRGANVRARARARFRVRSHVRARHLRGVHVPWAEV